MEQAGSIVDVTVPARTPLGHTHSIIGGIFVIVMGVSGTGKSTLGAALAETLRLPFVDGDDLHPVENVAKMARGEPLDDADRRPWLEAIRGAAIRRVAEQLGEREGNESGDGAGSRVGVVVACSALKRVYRAVLRGEGVHRTQTWTEAAFSLPTCFVYLKGDRDVLLARMQTRQGHFMKAGMLDSQLATLESPEGEPGVVTVSVKVSTEEQVHPCERRIAARASLPLPTYTHQRQMDHGGHQGHDMPAKCAMHMLWNTQIIDTCIVFPSWHVRSTGHFVFSFVAIVSLSVLYEYLRLFQRDVDARIKERVSKGKRAASPVSARSTPERGEDTSLLNGRRARKTIPPYYRVLRSALYGASVFLSCFLMLVFMTYNAYLIFAVVAGAAIGHYFYSGFVDTSDNRGASCH